MTPQTIVNEAKPRVEKTLERLSAELATLRTGRAHAGLVENIQVEQYGQVLPLKAVASITVQDASSIVIAPWDQNMVSVVEKTIREDAALGLNPASDGRVIRLNVPPMTEERRREIVKDLKAKVENCHIGLRNIRHDAINEARSRQKTGDFTQDDSRLVETELNRLMDTAKKRVDEIASAKEQEILTV